jgi:hypothetical protein
MFLMGFPRGPDAPPSSAYLAWNQGFTVGPASAVAGDVGLCVDGAGVGVLGATVGLADSVGVADDVGVLGCEGTGACDGTGVAAADGAPV